MSKYQYQQEPKDCWVLLDKVQHLQEEVLRVKDPNLTASFIELKKELKAHLELRWE